jgi:hypothetical protein
LRTLLKSEKILRAPRVCTVRFLGFNGGYCIYVESLDNP